MLGSLTVFPPTHGGVPTSIGAMRRRLDMRSIRQEQNGAGDDIIVGEKTYSCEVYGVNCAVPVAEWVKCVSLSAAAASLLGLIVLTSVAVWRRYRRH